MSRFSESATVESERLSKRKKKGSRQKEEGGLGRDPKHHRSAELYPGRFGRAAPETSHMKKKKLDALMLVLDVGKSLNIPSGHVANTYCSQEALRKRLT